MRPQRHLNPLVRQIIALCFLTAFVGSATGAEGERRAAMPKVHAQALFKAHCFDCHDSSAEEAGINLEDISYEVSSDVENAALWQKILNAINSGEMPPPDEERIPDDLKLEFLEELTTRMVTARMILGDSGGFIPLRRLNRREYANTIESLLGIRPDVSSLPDDQTGAGFDTQGASLFMSSDQIEQYIATARVALNRSLQATEDVGPSTIRIEPEEKYTQHYRNYLAELTANYERSRAFQAQSDKPSTAFGLIDPHQADVYIRHYTSWHRQLEQYLKWPETQTGIALIQTIKGGGKTRVDLPTLQPDRPGKYKIRVRAGRYREAESRFHYLEFAKYKRRSSEHIGWRKVTASLESPEIIEFDFVHEPGQSTNLRLHQRSHQDRGDKALWSRAQAANGVGLPPGIWIDWVELTGPEPIDGPLKARQRVFPQRDANMSESEHVRSTIVHFARLAFRGKNPTEEYLEKLYTQYRFHRGSGRSVEQALVESMALILASPEFLYMVNDGLVTEGQEQHPIQLAGTELAVRLSYMLWSSPPDDELMSLAESGQLDDPVRLRQQTYRLLKDPRSIRFVRDFTHQWLDMDRLGMFQFNGLLFPTFDNAVRESAREEIFQSVNHLLRQNLPLGNLLNADYVMVNDVLADFYGLPDVEGHAFRQIALPKDSPRGGLLGTAAVAAMGSDGLRPSPVERGAWVLRHLLHDPPAPAPPNVPQLSRLEGEPRSARTLQRLHQEQPQCAQCHRKIDPIGYGLDNFSADGRWRSQEEIVTGKVREVDPAHQVVAFEIDPSGQLPTGESFRNYFELRSQIATKQEAFTRGFIEKLIAFGLGRPYGFTDEPLAESMMLRARNDGFTIDSIIHALVQSKPFQSK